MTLVTYDNGKKWYKTALHVHTPASSDFKEPDLSYKEYCQAFIDNGFKIIAITDHNTIDGIEPMMDARDKIREESDKDLLILPGVELTMYEEFHLLVIFPSNTNADHVRDFVSTLQLDLRLDTTPNAERKVSEKFKEIITKVKEKRALSIFAHADGSKGIIEQNEGEHKISHRIREEVFSDAYTKLAEMSFGEELNDINDYPIYSINKSDFHGTKYLSDPARANWFQCGDKPSHESIMQALFTPERINLVEPELNFKVIMDRLHISNGYLKDFDLSFNPGLNCIIGNRGTGKSLIIDAIKYVLDQVQEEHDNEQEILKRIYATHQNGTTITLDLILNKKKYSISRSVDINKNERKKNRKYSINEGAEIEIFEIIGDKKVRVENLEVLNQFTLYSQNQLEELKDRVGDQLKLVDQINPPNELLEKRRRLLENLKEGREK